MTSLIYFSNLNFPEKRFYEILPRLLDYYWGDLKSLKFTEVMSAETFSSNSSCVAFLGAKTDKKTMYKVGIWMYETSLQNACFICWWFQAPCKNKSYKSNESNGHSQTAILWSLWTHTNQREIVEPFGWSKYALKSSKPNLTRGRSMDNHNENTIEHDKTTN